MSKFRGLLSHKAIYSNKQDRFRILPSSESTELVIKILARLLLRYLLENTGFSALITLKEKGKIVDEWPYSLSVIGFRKRQEAGQRDRDRQIKGQRSTSLYQNN